MAKFADGMKAEILGLATRDGVSAFNLENIMGTAAHALMGWGIGKGIRYGAKMQKPTLSNRVIGKITSKKDV